MFLFPIHKQHEDLILVLFLTWYIFTGLFFGIVFKSKSMYKRGAVGGDMDTWPCLRLCPQSILIYNLIEIILRIQGNWIWSRMYGNTTSYDHVCWRQMSLCGSSGGGKRYFRNIWFANKVILLWTLIHKLWVWSRCIHISIRWDCPSRWSPLSYPCTAQTTLLGKFTLTSLLVLCIMNVIGLENSF